MTKIQQSLYNILRRDPTHHPHSNMSEQNEQNAERQPFQLRQQNTNKSLTAQLDVLMSLRRNIYDVCAIQEPYIDFRGKSRANNHWHILYPTTHDTAPHTTRSILLINANILTNNWLQLNIPHPDISAIEVSTLKEKIQIFNIYNDCHNNSAINAVVTYMKEHPPARHNDTPTHHIWVGDFNRHHPIWDDPTNAHLFTKRNLDLAQPLINALDKFNMKMALPAHIPTLKSLSTGNLTRVDNVFCSDDLLDAFISCDTDIAYRPTKSDHFPIISCIDLYTAKSNPPPRLNFRDVNWTDFRKTLKMNLSKLQRPAAIGDIQTFNVKLDSIHKAVWDTIDTHVSIAKPSPYAKRWWTPQLTTERKITAKLGRKSYLH